MRKILTATSIESFETYKAEYFRKLGENNEIDFVKYLQQ